MMIKYKERHGEIKAVEIERETEKFVIFSSGRKDSKISDWQSYHDSWDEARNHLLKKAERDIESRKSWLEVAMKRKSKIEAMIDPTTTDTVKAPKGEI